MNSSTKCPFKTAAAKLPHRTYPLCSRERHLLLDLGNRLAWVQALGASARAVENSVATVQTHAVLQAGAALALALVS